ncbi:MAG: response regulator [Anaerolineales bacterium]|nr:response regulator [Anaerolineales bacterium]
MKKILVVDDQPQLLELVAVTLQDNYQVLFAENGRQAIEIAQTERPDLILLDVMLYGSDLDGLEVCRHLKKDPATQGIPVVLLTAGGQRSDLEAGLAAGADDYFIKPFSPFALMKKIEAMIE